MKKTSDKVLDDLQRKYVYLMSGGYCKRCGEEVGVEYIEVAHLYGRRRKTVRWDGKNVYPLCKNDVRTGKVGCHQKIDTDHIVKTSFMYDVMSVEDVEDLQKLANLTLKDYPIDREQIKQGLKEKIKLLEE